MSVMPTVLAHSLPSDAGIPNHPRWPVLVYPGAVPISGDDPAAAFEALFARHGWPAAWRNGVFPFHHFHPDGHEVLGVYAGEVTVRIGGELGVLVRAQPGDVIVLPAGAGHCKVSVRGDLGVVGAYPGASQPSTCRPSRARHAAYLTSVLGVPRPAKDPVFGAEGPLRTHWPA
ncbi:MAG: cupin domain-containing protein [Proteobacteria bacterium]|nr:cupin domain-containing protein [Pseudomonadota bacterium]